MASFLFVSQFGDIAFLALRFKREGHKVRLFIEHPDCKDTYRGLLDSTPSPRPDRGEIVIIDSEGFGSYADKLRKAGTRVIGGGSWSDGIELNRSLGIGLMEAYGIKTPETRAFQSVQEAINFLSRSEGEWYYKPSGNKDAAFTLGGTVDMLARFMRRYPTKDFILQKKVKGTELSFEGWFDGKRFVYPFNSTAEDKRFLAGDIGPNVGCMGNVVWTYDSPTPILYYKTLSRIEGALARVKYIGPIDINTIIDSDGQVFGLEWTPRFGYDAIQALSLLLPNNAGEQFAEFANGTLNKFDTRAEFAFTVNVSMPPYPHVENATKMKGMPLDHGLTNHPGRVLLRDVMLDNMKLPMLAGGSGIVASIGGIGRDLSALRYEVLDFIKTFKIPNAQYRHDCCTRVESVLSELARLRFDGAFIQDSGPPDIAFELPDPPSVPRQPAPAHAPAAPITSSQLLTSLTIAPADPGMAPRFQ